MQSIMLREGTVHMCVFDERVHYVPCCVCNLIGFYWHLPSLFEALRPKSSPVCLISQLQKMINQLSLSPYNFHDIYPCPTATTTVIVAVVTTPFMQDICWYFKHSNTVDFRYKNVRYKNNFWYKNILSADQNFM